MLVRSRGPMTLREAEFGIFSQWGEDGIIQYLVGRVPIERKAFVEIGVEDYRECNTRFLLCNNNWEGLIVDSGTAHLRTLEEEGLRWRYGIDGVSRWVTSDNVNGILEEAGMTGDIGLLSLDIDGVDYSGPGRLVCGLTPNPRHGIQQHLRNPRGGDGSVPGRLRPPARSPLVALLRGLAPCAPRGCETERIPSGRQQPGG